MAVNQETSYSDRKDLEFVVQVRRTTSVTAGGRTFKFSALVVSGNGKDRVGYGLGKAREVSTAVKKASDQAKQNMIKIKKDQTTIPHTTKETVGATTIVMLPAPEGNGVIAGGTARAVFEAAGIENVTSKVIGSTNPINVIRAIISGFNKMATPETVAKRRGLPLERVLKHVNK
ncbi:MAG: 30S ribosomal protein S5 [Legionellales bacterium]|nr:30S ribosomal protein S5 [Legionellales bacterium]|tara:strand:+ start:1235 stop:1756 length:522 start_codon:yes stop_codon:yes gene_type:complete